MAGQHSKRNRRSASSKARGRRGRVVGIGTTAGAAVAFGLTPWASAPAAHADELDAILDPIISSLSAVDPTLAADATSLLSTLDSALTSSADASAPPAQSTDLASLYNQFFFEPSQAFNQDWIDGTTFLGGLTVSYDNFINGISADLGGPLLIGNGADGVGGGTLAEATGDPGGIFFGDGGSGATDGDGGRAAPAAAISMWPVTAGPAGPAATASTASAVKAARAALRSTAALAVKAAPAATRPDSSSVTVGKAVKAGPAVKAAPVHWATSPPATAMAATALTAATAGPAGPAVMAPATWVTAVKAATAVTAVTAGAAGTAGGRPAPPPTPPRQGGNG